MRPGGRGRQGGGERQLKEESYQRSRVGSAEWEGKTEMVAEEEGKRQINERRNKVNREEERRRTKSMVLKTR